MAVSLPSVSANSGTLTASGVGSGLDIKGLVSQLMAVEQRPLTLLSQQEADFQSKLTSLGTVSSAMSSLQSAASTLATASTTYTTSASDSTVLSASADSSAVAGSYSVNVTQLAQAQKLVSPALTQTSISAKIGAGTSTTLSITLGTKGAFFLADPARTPVTLTIDSTNNTLAGIRDAINAAKAGVTASIVNDGSGTRPFHLALTSNTTGAASSMKLLTSAGDPLITALLTYDTAAPTANFNEVQTAQNAALTVDGVAITSTTNSVTDAIQGATLNLTKTTGGAPADAITVRVQRDRATLSAALNSVVNAYNSANTTIKGITAKGAVLQGDWAVLGLQRQVRAILGGAQTTGGSYTTLTQLGISFQKDGSLALDSGKLYAALSANSLDAYTLVSAIGGALKSATVDVLGKTGPLSNETAGINSSLKDIGKRRTAIQIRLDATQARYEAQFRTLDTMMSRMNQTSTFLSQQLNNLPNYYNQG